MCVCDFYVLMYVFKKLTLHLAAKAIVNLMKVMSASIYQNRNVEYTS